MEKSAASFGGTLVSWIAQMANPGQLENERLVRESDARGLTEDLGIREVLGGVCYAIVTEYVRLILTKAGQKSFVEFNKDMESIPDSYRNIQARYKGRVDDYLLACKLCLKGRDMLSKWQKRIDTEKPANPAILKHWRDEADRAYRSVLINAERAKRLGDQLYATDKLASAGIGFKVLRNPDQPNDGSAILNALAKQTGCYMIALQSATEAHAVGFWIETSWWKSDSYVFIDPNAGIFRFDESAGFEAFVLGYWDAFLKKYTKAGIISYAQQ
jgi:hypothetical protein